MPMRETYKSDGVETDAQLVLSALARRIPWASKFCSELVESPAAKRAFEQLIMRGCDPKDLLLSLDRCCSGHMTKYVISSRELSGEMATFARKLMANAKQLQKLEASANKDQIADALQLPEFQDLAVRLRACATHLQSEASRLEPQISAREAVSVGAAWLAARVEGSTEKPHYSEIAMLMQAFYSMRGVHKDISSQAIQKQVKRYREKHALAYRHMKNMASREFGKRKGEYVSGKS